MATTARQTRLYTMTFDVWRATIAIGEVGKPGGKTWARVATGIKGYLQRKPSQSAPDVAGRMERDIIFTLDHLHVYNDADVQDADLVKCTTPTDHKRLNRFWSIRGEAQDTGTYGVRHVNNQVFVCNLLEPNAVPDGVS